MTLGQAQRICMDIDAKHMNGIKAVKWSDVYTSEEQLLEELKQVKVPTIQMPVLYRGYEYIHNMAKHMRMKGSLSEAQMKQAKRLAIEIHKAYSIREFVK